MSFFFFNTHKKTDTKILAKKQTKNGRKEEEEAVHQNIGRLNTVGRLSTVDRLSTIGRLSTADKVP